MKYDIKTLSLEEKIGQMIIVGLNTETSVKNLEEIIGKYKVGGVLLYKRNYQDNYENMVKLVNRIRTLNQKNKIPMFISIDQEGGRVNRIPKEFKNLPAANALVKKSEGEDFVKCAGKITGEILHKLGINMDFAPVLDIKRFDNHHAIGDRAYSEKIEEVSKYGVEYMKALQENGVISVAKHFPGHGATKTDSHFHIPKIEEEIQVLEKEDMQPFEKAMKCKVDGILIGHLKIPKVTGSLPASMSKRFITKYIRKQYRYNGLIITDDVRMKGVKIRYGRNHAVKKAFLACNDMIILKYDKDIEVIDKIIKLVKEDKQKMKRVNKSVSRILKVKDQYNLNDELIEKDEPFITRINKKTEEIRQKVLSL